MVFWKKINDLFFCVLNFVVASSSQSNNLSYKGNIIEMYFKIQVQQGSLGKVIFWSDRIGTFPSFEVYY